MCKGDGLKDGFLIDGVENLSGAADVLVDIGLASFHGRNIVVGVGQYFVDPCSELHECVVAESALTAYDVVCFFEFSVIGTEDDWFSKSECFENVVYSVAPTAADIGYVGVVVDRREHAHIVDNQHRSVGGFGVAHLRISHTVAFAEELFYPGYVCLADDVWGQDEFQWRYLGRFEILEQVFFVWFPTASGDDDFGLCWVVPVFWVDKPFYGRVRFDVSGDVEHAVEPCIPGNGAFCDAVRLKELYGFLVLDKKVVKRMELVQEPFAVGFEEIL